MKNSRFLSQPMPLYSRRSTRRDEIFYDSVPMTAFQRKSLLIKRVEIYDKLACDEIIAVEFVLGGSMVVSPKMKHFQFLLVKTSMAQITTCPGMNMQIAGAIIRVPYFYKEPDSILPPAPCYSRGVITSRGSTRVGLWARCALCINQYLTKIVSKCICL